MPALRLSWLWETGIGRIGSRRDGATTGGELSHYFLLDLLLQYFLLDQPSLCFLLDQLSQYFLLDQLSHYFLLHQLSLYVPFIKCKLFTELKP